jgi:beta-galactosidase
MYPLKNAVRLGTLAGALTSASSLTGLIAQAQPVRPRPVRPVAPLNAPRERALFNANWRFLKEDGNDGKPLGKGYEIPAWRWKSGNDLADLAGDTSGEGWKTLQPRQDVFGAQKSFAWFRSTLSPLTVDSKTPLVLRFEGVDDNATVYLNGQKLFSHQGWGQPFEVPLNGVWKSGVANELAVLVENTEGPGGIGKVGFQIGEPVLPSVGGPRFDDAKWRQLDLPHDWGIEGPFDINLPGDTGKLPWPGVGWYRKSFLVPSTDRGRRISLEIDGAMSNATVYLNGKKVGGWPYGYASWAVDLTPFLQFGQQNVLAIRLDNLPNSSRWYPGGGIYRNVWLTKTSPLHIAHWGTQVSSVVTGADSKVSVKTTLQNETSAAREVRLVSTILDANGRQVASGEKRVQVGTGNAQVVESALTIPKAQLWSLQNRHLYTLVSQVKSGDRVLDRTTTSFGVRTITWNATQGFLLNGQRVPLNGVCMHHDLGALGAAWNTRAAERQLQILARMGVNAIRTSHNPPAPELLALCDRMGFLVLDEFSDTWTRAKTANGYATLFEKWADKDLRAMIRRDRNHPSIIAWSIGNEVGEQGDAAGAKVSQFLADIVHSEDKTRPVTSGNNYPQAGTNGFQKTLDVFGYNYKPHLYGQFRAKNPDQPLYGSETASTISSRGEYVFPVTDDKSGGKSDFQMSSYDLYAPSWATPPDWEFKGQDENPFVAGEFVWTGFDYLGEPTPYNADTTNLLNFTDPVERAKMEAELKELGRITVPSRSSYFGIVDLAGFPKDRFYIYQARWRPNLPMVHILPHWNWPERIGQVTPVHLYTSGDEAELFLNGKSLGRKKRGQYEYRLRWNDVVYQPGELRAVAYKNGKLWAQETVRTTGSAAKLSVQADRNRIAADGTDLSFVTVKILDSKGQNVPRSNNALSFSVSGPGEIVATDNGNAIDLTTFNSKNRRAYNGLALGIVRAKKGQSGPITLRVTSPGLGSSSVLISARK